VNPVNHRCDNCSRLAMELSEARMRIAVLERALEATHRVSDDPSDVGNGGGNPDR